MPTGITRNRNQLRERIHRFFKPTAPVRADLFETLKELERYGRVLVFGGAIRDLALHGSTVFPSDIDVVIESANFELMTAHLRALGATSNRFGGFRFATQRWKYDVWRLEDTWALREGYVSGGTAEALLESTFFDWDAVAYDFSEKRLLVSDDYFERLDAGFVGINLPATPNPTGNARRALKIYESGRAGLESRLVHFVAETTRTYWEHGLEPEAESVFPGLNTFLGEFHRASGNSLLRRNPQMSLT
jgi:hypothetical protein